MESIPVPEFVLPTTLVFGEGSRHEAGARAVELGVTRALLVSDAGVVAAGLTGEIAERLAEAGLGVARYDEVDPNPRVSSVDGARDLFLAEECDGVIAVGGGSVIDTAKAAALLVSDGGEVADYDFTLAEPRTITRRIAPLVALPTTAGTGSEVTFWAVITDESRRAKLGLGGPLMAPHVALVDPELTYSLPPDITAYSGLDALTHAVEAYTATNAGPLSDLLAMRAIRLVTESLRTAVDDRADVAARRSMMLASTLAGAAFTNSDVGAVHCLAEIIGGMYDLPHGLVCAMYLPGFTEFSAPGAPERYAAAARALGVQTGGFSAAEVGAAAARRLRELATGLGVPVPRDVGVLAQDHEVIARRCAADIEAYAVPRAPSEGDILGVLAAADQSR